MIYQKYLESVIEKATQFHEINDLILRFEVLPIFPHFTIAFLVKLFGNVSFKL
uniref:Uncharacterized protein n=1 Tax=Physcomitrium patens TaxID=3218 RepID=A0A7I3ZE19_PHYPA